MTNVVVTSSYRKFVLIMTGGDFAVGQRAVGALPSTSVRIGSFSDGV